MRGLNRTAPLAFGHPGLGTTAVRANARLIIQNDIGTTDATNFPICWWDFGGAQAGTGGNYTLTIAGTGIFTATVT